jgi:uncharacterized protein YggT (Ycf19 family)
MGLIDFILDIAGVLVWFSWRSIRYDPLVKTTPATLVGTLRRAEPRRLKGWQHLAGLAALLVLRALLYRQIGPDAEWTPKLNLFYVILAFRSDLFFPTLLFSVLSFARILIVCYFWLLALAIINRHTTEPNPMQKLVRLHLGPVARWHLVLQLLLPLFLIIGLWFALHPLLVHLKITSHARSSAHLAEQGILIASALLFSLQYLLPVFLLLYLVASYVYWGSNVLWEFIGATARNLMAPLRRLPLRIAMFDFTPLVGVILIFALLHWLPNFILGKLAQHNVNPWPL